MIGKGGRTAARCETAGTVIVVKGGSAGGAGDGVRGVVAGGTLGLTWGGRMGAACGALESTAGIGKAVALNPVGLAL